MTSKLPVDLSSCLLCSLNRMERGGAIREDSFMNHELDITTTIKKFIIKQRQRDLMEWMNSSCLEMWLAHARVEFLESSLERRVLCRPKT